MRQMSVACEVEPRDLEWQSPMVELYDDKVAVRIGSISLHGTASDIRQLLLNAIATINTVPES